MIRHGSKVVDTLFVHCSATRPDWMESAPLAQKVAEIRRWHMEPRSKDKKKPGGLGAGDIGYHYIIDRDGQIAQGRAENIPGAHVAGHNTGSIGVCLIGGHGSSESDPFEKNFTPAQDAALRKLIDNINSRTTIKHVRGHNEVAAKACPGFSVKRWSAQKSAKPSMTESTTMRASAAQIASGAVGGVTAIGALDGNAQIVAIVLCAVVIAAGAWIMRERIRKWSREVAE
jgi:N-acetylmuramoyl-L-alanine amidase